MLHGGSGVIQGGPRTTLDTKYQDRQWRLVITCMLTALEIYDPQAAERWNHLSSYKSAQ